MPKRELWSLHMCKHRGVHTFIYTTKKIKSLFKLYTHFTISKTSNQYFWGAALPFPGRAREAEVCTLPCVTSQFVKLVFLRCPTLGDSILSTDEGQDDRQGIDWQRSNFLLKVKRTTLLSYPSILRHGCSRTVTQTKTFTGPPDWRWGQHFCLIPDTKAFTNLPSDHLVGAQDQQAENLWQLSSCLPVNPAPHGPACPLLQMKFPEASPTGFLSTPPLLTASTSLSAPCLRKASLNSAVASLALL